MRSGLACKRLTCQCIIQAYPWKHKDLSCAPCLHFPEKRCKTRPFLVKLCMHQNYACIWMQITDAAPVSQLVTFMDEQRICNCELHGLNKVTSCSCFCMTAVDWLDSLGAWQIHQRRLVHTLSDWPARGIHQHCQWLQCAMMLTTHEASTCTCNIFYHLPKPT